MTHRGTVTLSAGIWAWDDHPVTRALRLQQQLGQIEWGPPTVTSGMIVRRPHTNELYRVHRFWQDTMYVQLVPLPGDS